jgi:hypothetical protein
LIVSFHILDTCVITLLLSAGGPIVSRITPL